MLLPCPCPCRTCCPTLPRLAPCCHCACPVVSLLVSAPAPPLARALLWYHLFPDPAVHLHDCRAGTSLGGWIACLAVAAQQQQEPKQWQQQQQQQQEQGPAICRLLLINPAIDISETWWQGMSSAEQQQVLASGVACLRSAYLEPGEEQLVGLSFFEQVRCGCC